MTGFGGRVPAGLLSDRIIDVIVNVRIDIVVLYMYSIH